jgi:cell division protein ZapA
MGQVSVTLNGRSYRLACGDGEEGRLLELASHVKARVDQLTLDFGQVGDGRLLLMAALLIADELWDTRKALEVQIEEAAEMLRSLTEPGTGPASAAASPAATKPAVPGARSKSA